MATILIIDDTATNREFIVNLLGYYGHRLIEAGDGLEGLELARSNQPDLVIVDILMPSMNGYEFVSKMRQDRVLAQIPVIFYSATFLEREAHALAESCGVTECLTKPAEPELIVRTVNQVLGLDPTPMLPPRAATGRDEAVPLLIDAIYEKGQKLSALDARLATLVDVGLELAHERGSTALLAKFCHAARKITGAEYAAVGLLDLDQSKLTHFFTSGVAASVPVRLPAPIPGDGAIARVIRERRPCRLRANSLQPGELALPGEIPCSKSLLGVPVESSRQLYGWLCLSDKLGADEFTEEDERVAATLAAQAAVSLENVRVIEEIQAKTWQLELEVAQRTQAQRALLVSEQRYRLLFENSPLPTWVVDLESGVFLAVNQVAVEHYGYSRGEFRSMNIRDLLLPEGISEMIETASGGTEQPKRVSACKHRKKDKTCIDVEVTSQVIEWEAQNARLEVVVDVTERKRLEEHLRQTQRLEAVGKLAGGVAHDFNNLLGVIIGHSEILMDRTPPGDARSHSIEMIKSSADRAASLTRQLLAFSRKQVLEPKVLDLNAIFANLQKLLQRLIGEDIELVIEKEKEPGRVKADPGQLEQVLMNLAVNARDAMPDGGRLTIATGNAELDETYTDRHSVVQPGRYVLLVVSDSGCGMDAETQSRIFEPFFTTKEKGKGTGMGLATVYGIVKQSGGYIWVYSEPGHGTTFKIYLPRVDAPAEKVGPPEALANPLRGSETVLIVEDDAPLRQLTQEFLESSGYTVLEAASPAEALQVAARHTGSIHFLLTDVVMPGMNGRELARQLTATRPQVKVLYVSGYTDDAIMKHGVLEKGLAFLQKPYTRNALTRKLREVLDSKEKLPVS